VGGRTPPSRELICFSIPLDQEVVGVWVGRSPRDGDRIVALHLVEESIDARDNVFVVDRFDGAGRKQFDVIETAGDKVVARWGGWVDGFAPLPDPVQGMTEGAEFPRVAGGTTST